MNTYGYTFPAHYSQVEINLSIYAKKLKTEIGLHKHLSAAITDLFPQQKSTWFSWTDIMLEQFTAHSVVGGSPVVSVLGSSGSGKSRTAGLFAVADFLADPTNTVTLIASTTLADLEQRAWKYVKEFWSKIPLDRRPPGFELYKGKPQKIVSTNPEVTGGIYTIALEDDPEGEKLKGFHPKRLRIIVDEATAFSPAILNNIINWQSAGKEFELITLSNFRGLDNLCAAVSEPIGGWSSVNYEVEEQWKTKYGTCILLDAMKSPVYRDPSLSKKLFFLKTKEAVDEIIYGRGTDGKIGGPGANGPGPTAPRILQYIRSIPNFSADLKTVLSLELLEKGGVDRKVVFKGYDGYRLACLDPAFTTNGDNCVLTFGYLGTVGGSGLGSVGDAGGFSSADLQVLQFQEFVIIPIDSTSSKPAEYQILEYCVAACEKRDVPPSQFTMDGAGVGRGLGSIFKHEWSEDILVQSAAGRASDRIVDADFNKAAKDVYDRYATELHFNFRDYVSSGQVLGLSNEVKKQLCSRMYDDSRAKVRLETKPEYKKRLFGSDSAKGSPDEADTCVLMVPLAEAFGFVCTHKPPVFNVLRQRTEMELIAAKFYESLRGKETSSDGRLDAWSGGRYDKSLWKY